MRGNTRRVINKIMLGVALSISPVPDVKLRAEETSQEQAKETQFMKDIDLISKAAGGQDVNVEELKQAINRVSKESQAGTTMDYSKEKVKRVSDDAYTLFSKGYEKGANDKIKGEFLKGMLRTYPEEKKKEVERELDKILTQSKSKDLVLAAIEGANYMDTDQIAVDVLQRMFDKDEEIVKNAMDKVLELKATPNVLLKVRGGRGGDEDRIKIDNIAIIYELKYKDGRMGRALADALSKETSKNVLASDLRLIQETDMVFLPELRRMAIEKVVQYPEIMGSFYITSLFGSYREGKLNIADISADLGALTEKYEKANDKAKGEINRMIGAWYAVNVFLTRKEDFLTTAANNMLGKINSERSVEARVGAVEGLAYICTAWNNSTKYEYLNKVLREMVTNEKEAPEVRAAAAIGLGRNGYGDALNDIINTMETSEDKVVREGCARGIYELFLRNPVVFNVGGIEENAQNEVERIKTGKGSGVVLNYLFIILANMRHSTHENKGLMLVKNNDGDIIGIEVLQKPKRSKVPDIFWDVTESDKKEMQDAYEGWARYMASMARENLLTEREADTVISGLDKIYEYAKGKKGEEKANLYEALVGAYSAISTNYQKDDGGKVAKMLKEMIDEGNQPVCVRMLRVLREDLVSTADKNQVYGIGRKEEIARQASEIVDRKALLPSLRGEAMMLLIKLKAPTTISLNIEPEWPWQPVYRVRITEKAYRRVLFGGDVLTDRPA
jgi:HEAT repeat protein